MTGSSEWGGSLPDFKVWGEKGKLVPIYQNCDKDWLLIPEAPIEHRFK
jgi:hypothetical protein